MHNLYVYNLYYVYIYIHRYMSCLHLYHLFGHDMHLFCHRQSFRVTGHIQIVPHVTGRRKTGGCGSKHQNIAILSEIHDFV